MSGQGEPPRLPPLIGALVIIAAFAGVAVALLRVADRREADRAAREATSTTTVPSVGVDRQPTGTPRTTPTTKTVAPAPTTTGPDDEGPPIVLKGDGIGAFLFGSDPDQVIAGLTLRWGPPDGDSGWVAAASSPYGPCPGTVVRGVDWRGFTVLFSDGATPRGQAGTRHFFTWQYQADKPDRPAPDRGGNRPPLQTATKISVGATVPALQQAYGDRLELFDEAPIGPQFGVQTSEGGIYGSLTGLDAGGVIRWFGAGGGCATDPPDEN